jgi:lipopolysaccharide assembly protein A
MRLIGWTFGAVVALALILFAVSNRELVALKIEPLPFFVELPLYAALLAALFAGFVAGGLVSWLGSWKWRRRARRAEGEAERLRRERAEAERRPVVPPAAAPQSPRELPRAS